KVQGRGNRRRDLIAKVPYDIDHPILRKTASLDQVRERERAGLMRDDEVDVPAVPLRARQQAIDEFGESAGWQLEQVTPAHLKEAACSETLRLPVKIDAGAAGRELARLIAVVMGLKQGRADGAGLFGGRRGQHRGSRT